MIIRITKILNTKLVNNNYIIIEIEIRKNQQFNFYNFIKNNPGLHFRELQRRLKFPLTSLEYHLSYMVRKKILLNNKIEMYY